MDCNATPIEFVVFDNGTRIQVEEVISNPDSNYTFVVIKDDQDNFKSLLLDNCIIVESEWR